MTLLLIRPLWEMCAITLTVQMGWLSRSLIQTRLVMAVLCAKWLSADILGIMLESSLLKSLGYEEKLLKMLLTGDAGFIGSAVVRHLIYVKQHDVVSLDKLTCAGNLESLMGVSNSDLYTFEHVDICDIDELKRAFEHDQPDKVMHLAAELHVDRSIDGPAVFIGTNMVGTYSMLEAVRQYWMGLDATRKASFRFHHISTDEVYGDLYCTDDFFAETTFYSSSSPYSVSRAVSDHMVRAWLRTYRMSVVITNCSNTYGPYRFPEEPIPHVILNAIHAKPLPMYGDGLQIRDWLYVEDHAKALFSVVTEGKFDETCNIVSHNEKTNLEVVETICGLLE